MKFDILLSCMYQQDGQVIWNSRITGNALVINQCDREGEHTFPTEKGDVRWIDTTQRGLTKSRNMAVRTSKADVCLLCDDDETFEEDYERKILDAYAKLPQADVIVFKMTGRDTALRDVVARLRFPQTMHVCSWQISFRRESLIDSGIRFDELLGAGTGNGAEEELKFLLDCERAGLQIWYVPTQIASVAQTKSTWFHGFDEQFFYNRGATTRYILGFPIAVAYAVYYVLRKRKMYSGQIAPEKAMRAVIRGICDNKIGKQAKAKSPALRKKVKIYKHIIPDRSDV